MLKSVNPAVGWLLCLTLAFLASSSSSAMWLAVFCCIPLIAIGLHVTFNGSKYPKIYLALASFVVLVRIGFRVLFGSSSADSTGWALPSVDLNLGWLGNLHLLGFVSLSSVLSGFTDGLRLAAIILSVAMASTLISARSLLRHTPAALYELSTAVSISVNLAPQLVSSLARVQRAKLLRGRSKKVSLLASIVIPVLEDTIDQSLALAASMDSRGFGFLKAKSKRRLRALLAIAFVLIAIGIYLLLTQITLVAYVCLLLSLVCTSLVVRTAASNSLRTNAKPLLWAPLDIASLIAIVILVALRISGWWQP